MLCKKEIHDLGGTLELLSEQGKGTTFIFRLPFTVSMNRALLVGCWWRNACGAVRFD